MSNDRKIQILNRFKNAYLDLVEEFENDNNLNELDSVELYPFERSFEDYDVVEWVNESIKELKMGEK